MADPWIKMRTNLHTDPRVVSLAQTLSVSTSTIVGALHFIWSYADMFSDNGRIGYAADYIDRQVCLPGFCTALANLTNCGKPRPWLKIETDGVSICNFKDHNGQTAKARALSASRMSKMRDAPVTPALRAERNKSAPEQSRAEQIRINTSASSKPDTPVPACLPAGQATVGELLSIIGIGGHALQMLAIAPTLTPEIVRREFRAAHGPKVKDPRRVLVRALCDLTGVVLPKKGGRPKAELIEALGGSMKINDLERMRMNRRGAAG